MVIRRSGAGRMVKDHNSMNMIGHDDKYIQVYIRKMTGNIVPALINDPACIIQLHLPIHDFPEKAFPVPGNNRQKIRAFPGIIISL